MEWKKGIIQSDTNTSRSAIVVKSGNRHFILPESRFYPGLNKLRIGWEIYFQANKDEVIDVFMYGPKEEVIK